MEPSFQEEGHRSSFPTAVGAGLTAKKRVGIGVTRHGQGPAPLPPRSPCLDFVICEMGPTAPDSWVMLGLHHKPFCIWWWPPWCTKGPQRPPPFLATPQAHLPSPLCFGHGDTGLVETCLPHGLWCWRPDLRVLSRVSHPGRHALVRSSLILHWAGVKGTVQPPPPRGVSHRVDGFSDLMSEPGKSAGPPGKWAGVGGGGVLPPAFWESSLGTSQHG